MKCNIFEYECKKCGCTYDSPVYLGGYGMFLLKNYGSNRMAILNAISDKVFKEVGALVRRNERLIHLNESVKSKFFQGIIGYMYDPDCEGFYFGLNAMPECPYCKAHSVLSYREKEPHEIVEYDFPVLSADNWENMCLEQKVVLVDYRLQEAIAEKGSVYVPSNRPNN